jgi:hypothetical protein
MDKSPEDCLYRDGSKCYNSLNPIRECTHKIYCMGKLINNIKNHPDLKLCGLIEGDNCEGTSDPNIKMVGCRDVNCEYSNKPMV